MGLYEDTLSKVAVEEGDKLDIQPKDEIKDEPKDAPKDEIKDAPKDEPKDEPKDDIKDEPKDEPKGEFSFDTFKSYAKEKHEIDIDSEDDLKSYFEKAGERDEYSTKVGDLEQKVSELTEIASKGVAGRDWFVNDDEFVRQQFLMNKSGDFSESALSVLSNLSPEKIKKLDPIEAIRISTLIDNTDLEKSEMEALISRDYGLVDGVEEQSAADKAKVKVDGNRAKKSLSKLYDGIEIPKAVDLEAIRTEQKDSWSPTLKELEDGIDEIKVTKDFTFKVSPEMKKGMADKYMNKLLSSQTKVSESAAAEIAGKMRTEILVKNLDKIWEVATAEISEREKEKWRKEVHNDSDLNNDKRAEGDDSDGEAMTGKEFMDKVL